MNNVGNGTYEYYKYYYILYCHSVVQLYLIKKAALLYRAKGQHSGSYLIVCLSGIIYQANKG